MVKFSNRSSLGLFLKDTTTKNTVALNRDTNMVLRVILCMTERTCDMSNTNVICEKTHSLENAIDIVIWKRCWCTA